MIEKLYKTLLIVIIIYFITITISIYKNFQTQPIINVVVDTDMLKNIDEKTTSNYNWIELVKKEGFTINCE